MDQLTILDAGFLEAEDSDGQVSLAIGDLAILEGPIPDYDALISTLSARMGVCPRFAQRLRLHSFDLGAPEWADDDDFDITHHVRRISLPAPGEDRELFDMIAEVMSWRLDRSRPLWEIWVIEGLSDNRWAMLVKVHHCIADGVATAHILAGLSDGGIRASVDSHLRATAEAEPSAGRQGGSGANPLSWLSGLWSTPAAVTTAATRAARGAAELAIDLLRPNSSPLNGSITNLRRYSAARVSLRDVREVCRMFDVTINDVALAALAESYRDVLIRRGEQPLPDSLRTLVPVSEHSADALGEIDDRVSVMLPYLPVEEQNPVQRLRMVHSRLARTTDTGQRDVGSAIVSVANYFIPFAVTAWAVRLLTRLPQNGVATVATNVAGPSQQLRVMGRKVVGVLPIPPIAMQLRTGVTTLSYADDLFFGILADFDAVPDIDELAHGVEVAVARLVASGGLPDIR